MKKIYLKGYTYEFHRRTLISNSQVTLENTGRYGIDKMLASIVFENGSFNIYFTDGFVFLKVKYGFSNLKQALNHAHAWLKLNNHKGIKSEL